MQRETNEMRPPQGLPRLDETARFDNQRVAAVYWCDIPTYVTIEDLSTDAGRHFISAIKIAANNARSPVYWGRTKENPDIVICVLCRDGAGLGSDGLEAHLAAKQPPWRFAATKLLLKVCQGYPKIYHIDFFDNPIPALEMPVTLVGTAYFPADAESEPRRSNLARVMMESNAKTQSNLHARPGAQYNYMGWAFENDVLYTSFDGLQKQGNSFYMLSGWPSIQAQNQFYLGEGMEDESRSMITGGPDGWRLMHISFSKVEPDTIHL